MTATVPPGKPIKLVVWQLDDAQWTAALAGGALAPGIAALIATLDDHGVLQSVVTRWPGAPVAAALARLELAAYFLSPQLGAVEAGAAVAEIAQRLNLGLDATLVIGGDAGEVTAAHPAVRALPGLSAAGYAQVARDPLIGPSLAAIEPRPRRLLYVEEQARAEAERSFAGSKQDFVASLGMKLTLAPARSADLHRVRELVTRTNQLGVRYDDAELTQLIASPRHACWLVALEDRFGDCGQVGLAVVEHDRARWTLQLLQFSCRALPRGVDAIVLDELVRRARGTGAQLVVEVRPTRKNAAMLEAYHRAGFVPCGGHDDVILLARDAIALPALPAGVHVTFERATRPSA